MKQPLKDLRVEQLHEINKDFTVDLIKKILDLIETPLMMRVSNLGQITFAPSI